MMTITIDGKVYDNVPESYDETTLSKFIDIARLDNKRSEYKSNILFTMELLSILIGCHIDELLSISIDDVEELHSAFNWTSVVPKKVKKKITIDGIVYVCKEHNQLTAGEQISIESWNSQFKDSLDSLHLVLAILFRPLVDGKITPLESDINVITERANLFRDKMMAGDVIGLSKNFTNGGKKSSKISQVSSRLKIVRSNQSSGKKLVP